MLDKKRALEIVHLALKNSPADQTEAVLMADQTNLTRFAESVIHQNMSQEETRLVVTTVKEKRIGIAATNDLSASGIRAAVTAAYDNSLLQNPDDRFVSFPTSALAPPLAKTESVEPDERFTPDMMAQATANVIQEIDNHKGLTASGAFRHEIHAVAVANSLGVAQFGRFGKAELSLTASGETDNAGYAIGFNPDPAKIDYAALAGMVIRKAEADINPVTLPDGKYTVILEPPAVGQLLLFLGFMGFGGKTVLQQRSFLSGKKGESITGENITITDEPDNPLFGNLLFDYEGIPVKKLTIIDHGRAGDAAYDSYYAAQANVAPTGHALPPDNSYGPYPKSLAIAPGDKTLEEMIASTDKGVLITHFWYINFLNPMQTMITGTTRDGTFLIENGRVGAAVKNMRTNQSILEAFSKVRAISSNRIVYPQFSSLMLVPAMKIDDFDLVQETKEEWEEKC
jgi:predicted Zn-dependent protease